MVAKIKVNWEKNPYSGVFSDSSSIGYIRCSSATPPTEQNTAPGFALKILRDKVRSGNFMAMWSLFGQDNDPNFFTHAFSNHVNALPPAQASSAYMALKALVSKFEYQDPVTSMVGLGDLSEYNNAG